MDTTALPSIFILFVSRIDVLVPMCAYDCIGDVISPFFRSNILDELVLSDVIDDNYGIGQEITGMSVRHSIWMMKFRNDLMKLFNNYTILLT